MTSTTTYGAWLKRWLARTSDDWAPSTRQARAYVIQRYLEPLLGDVALSAIDARRVTRFKNAVLAKSNSASATRNAMKLLGQSLNAAVAEGLIASNPVSSSDDYAYRPAAAPPIPTVQEIERIRRQLPTDRDRALLGLMAYCGLPPREALALQWGDFLLEYRRLRPRRKFLAGQVQELPPAQWRTVDVPMVVSEDLDAFRPEHQREPDAWVFPGQGDKPRSFNSWRTDVWYPACRRAGLQVAPKELRFVFAALLHQEGRTATFIAAALGASSRTRAFDTYLRHLPDPAKPKTLQTAVWLERHGPRRELPEPLVGR